MKKTLKWVVAPVAASVLALGGATLANATPDAGTNPPLSATSTPAEADAINYVDSRMGDTNYDGLCLGLDEDAYASAGVDLNSQASDNSSAVSFWDTTSDTKNPPSDNIPAGALVFWGATSSNPYGHVAISLGGDTAASSEERDNFGIHTFSISARDNDGYTQLGWIMPA